MASVIELINLITTLASPPTKIDRLKIPLEQTFGHSVHVVVMFGKISGILLN